MKALFVFAKMVSLIASMATQTAAQQAGQNIKQERDLQPIGTTSSLFLEAFRRNGTPVRPPRQVNARHPESNPSPTGQNKREVRLNALIQEALQNNPQIQAARRMVDAKQAMVEPARTLPDPVIGFQTMGNLIPPSLQSGDPSSARVISFSQPIPFPGKLSLKGKMASEEARAQWWDYEQTRRDIIAQVKVAYYDLYFVDKSIEIVERDKDLLEKFERIAEAKYQVGQGIQQDVLKAQVEISRLVDRLTVLQQHRGVFEAQLNSLLYRPPGTPLGKPAEIVKSESRYSMDELFEMAVSSFPILKRQQRRIDRSEFAVQLAKKDFYPDFEVGFSYFNRTPIPEMYALTFKAKVPLYFWRKQRPRLQGAASELASSRKQYDNLTSLVYFKLKDQYLAATTSERLIELYGKAIVPQATLALESSVASYEVGEVDFLSLLDNLITLLDYELKYHESLADYQKALAKLEPFVGVELTR